MEQHEDTYVHSIGVLSNRFESHLGVQGEMESPASHGRCPILPQSSANRCCDGSSGMHGGGGGGGDVMLRRADCGRSVGKDPTFKVVLDSASLSLRLAVSLVPSMLLILWSSADMSPFTPLMLLVAGTVAYTLPSKPDKSATCNNIKAEVKIADIAAEFDAAIVVGVCDVADLYA